MKDRELAMKREENGGWGGGIGGGNIRCARERDRVLVCKKERYVH